MATVTEVSKVHGVVFGILSAQEIERMSVVEITTKDTFVNGSPVMGGIFDPRMGTSESGKICPTDGNNYIVCPGYFGHLPLEEPVFYIQFLDAILDILRMVCIRCSKLLIDKVKFAHLLQLPNDQRWKRVHAMCGAGKIKRCGEQNDGCGCKQPKFKKNGFAGIHAEWMNQDEKSIMKISPKMALQIFRRMSDEDVTYIGLNPVFSRPENMICQILAVPPPAVRPSVKQDQKMRCEDDLSAILIQIIRANKALRDKKAQDPPNPMAIEEEHTILQYFVGTLVDNKMPQAQPAALRSGRPYKDIKQRLNGKNGRLRGNLMGKRVDFSARSVITPDPNLSIREVGVPLPIAKNITKPITVNVRNIEFLTRLVLAGPDVHPGAKLVEKNGHQISLRHADRTVVAANLVFGDIVHRHMLDGDFVIFNRQPSLHKMSMMGHEVRILPEGNSFRMNVGDTKPYNADFDGDEMNLHMPQDEESAIEIAELAAVPKQIISPTTNQSIIGIFQDALLGTTLLTSSVAGVGKFFSPQEAMALCTRLPRIDAAIFKKGEVSAHEIISLILPSMTLYCPSKADTPVRIQNGQFLSGKIDKSALSASSLGIIHRIFNDFGERAAADFIDNLQNIVTAYMSKSAYSVGVSDLLCSPTLRVQMDQVIGEHKTKIKALITSTILQTGEFKNDSEESNYVERERQIIGILGEANEEVGKLMRKELREGNRFVEMVKAGSKGSEINIAQMIALLGMQIVDGKRIPYGYDDRTLPHFQKFDDSAEARGFVESSFIDGLSPTGLFFHAVSGRVGLIDTAVKTSQTGYIQRRLIKGLEDLKQNYDGTVRTSKGYIVQFHYGDDNIDSCKVEELPLKLVFMDPAEIFTHFLCVDNLPMDTEARKRFKAHKPAFKDRMRDLVEYMVLVREPLSVNVFNRTDECIVRVPVNIPHIIKSVSAELGASDMTPLEAIRDIDKAYNRLMELNAYAPSQLFYIVFYFYLSPVRLIQDRFTQKALALVLEKIERQYLRAMVAPGEMVGITAAQSIGAPITQLTLNTFHFAGVASKCRVTQGIPRVEEIISLSPKPKDPSCTVYFNQLTTDGARATTFKTKIEHTSLADITHYSELLFEQDESSDPAVTKWDAEFNKMMEECGFDRPCPTKSKWVFRLVLNKEAMHDRGITMDDVHFAVKFCYEDCIDTVYSDYNDSTLVFRVILRADFAKKRIRKPIDDSDGIYKIKQFEDDLLGITIRGVRNVKKAIVRKVMNNVVQEGDKFVKQNIWVLDTIGSNLVELLALPEVDSTRTTTTDIREICEVLGIEAARRCILDELTDVLDEYINYHHLSVLADRMTAVKMVPMFRSGIKNDDIGPIAKASFEETPQIFLDAAKFADIDLMQGVSANTMCGQKGPYGTNMATIHPDLDKFVAVDPEPIVLETGVAGDINVFNHYQASIENSLPSADFTIDL